MVSWNEKKEQYNALWAMNERAQERCRIVKAAVHWVRVNVLRAESSPKLTWDAMGLRADSARWLSVRAEPLRAEDALSQRATP